MNLTGIIVARQGSSRLPRKALAEIVGKPIIGLIYERLKACKFIDQIIVATTTNSVDDEIENYCKQSGIEVFRGDPEDVLARIHDAIENIETDAIIEVGGDCPFVSLALLEEGVNIYKNNPDADIVSNAILPPYTFPDGYDFILVTKKAINDAYQNATFSSERFQPFQYFVKNRTNYNIVSFIAPEDHNAWRWTLDYKEDLQFVKAVFEKLYMTNPDFGFDEISKLLKTDTSIINLNIQHAKPRILNSAWYTGSYVSESHADLTKILGKAFEFETINQFEKARGFYEQAEKILNDLLHRAKTREENG